MDEIEKIIEFHKDGHRFGMTNEDRDSLIAEVERLRKIEDSALAFDVAPGGPKMRAQNRLTMALGANPRPTDNSDG